MQQIYMLEIFVDNVRVFVTGEEEKSAASKNMCVKIGFGPKTEIFIREHQLEPNNDEEGENVGDKEGSENKEASKTVEDDIVTVDQNGKRGWTRKVRVGKSFLFPSYSDTVLTTLRDFPLEIEVWNDDERETFIFVANGIMRWDKDFFEWLQIEDQPDELHDSFCVKQVVPLKSDCCCKIVGEITLILRLNAFGDSITTEFQATDDEDLFYIRSNKSPNVLHCKRLDPYDDLNFVTIGSIYDTVDLEDPTILGKDDVEVCTEFDAKPCSTADPCTVEKDLICRRRKRDKYADRIPENMIRMGDIKGPCGNRNCKLAHKVKTFLRKLKSYKEAAEKAGIKEDDTEDPASRKICGSCICKQEHWHRDGCPVKNMYSDNDGDKADTKSDTTQVNYLLVCGISEVPAKTMQTKDDSGNVKTRVCMSQKCQNTVCPEEKCTDKNATQVNPLSVIADIETDKDYLNYRDLRKMSRTCKNETCTRPECPEKKCEKKKDDKPGIFGKKYIVNNASVKYNVFPRKPCAGCGCQCQMKKGPVAKSKAKLPVEQEPSTSEDTKAEKEYDPDEMLNLVNEIRIDANAEKPPKERPSPFSQFVYKALNETRSAAPCDAEAAKNEDKECKCDPQKPTPPCKTFDCKCLTRNIQYASRKMHKPYCPSYLHKENCPVNKPLDDEENEEDEDEPEPLPYGLPPIQLGPCPVLGRPCSVPDGFARMYKVAAIPPQPPSWSDAGKICCSKEFERIKKAIEEYMKYEKDHDMRCLNRFNIDTERRCCDKEQRLIALIGKGCCGSHKMALHDKYKETKEKNKES